MSLTAGQKKLLKPYFSNLDRDVFALRNLPEVVKGALFSRYSRTDKNLREVLLTEFLENEDLRIEETATAQQAGDDNVQTAKAEDFFDRVLVGYGDDSVAELAGAHVAMENVSNVAAKVIEDARIGLSFLEKSSRYVTFADRVNGKFRYHRDPTLLDSKFGKLYEQTNDTLFGTYAELVEPMLEWVRKEFPQVEGESDRAYRASCKAKALDAIRGLLPAATQTNLGIFGNGRAFEYLLNRMYSHPLSEVRVLAEKLHRELKTVIPSFVKRANDPKHGQSGIAFRRRREQAAARSAQAVAPGVTPELGPTVSLVDYDRDAEAKVIAGILYAQTGRSYEEVRSIVQNLDPVQRETLMRDYLGSRENRRHRPGRGFEYADYTFDTVCNFGAYRDLHRHRLMTQQRQRITTHHGYDLPMQVVRAGLADKYSTAMNQAASAYDQIAGEFPEEAQYVVPLGYRLRFTMKLNLRELYHLVELRATPEGHPDYRRVAQEMYRHVSRVHPLLTKYMRFVDLSYQDGMERRQSENRTDAKLAGLEKNSS